MVGGGWQGSGSAIRLNAVTAASRPSMCGIFVYRDETSIDASTHSLASVVASIRFMKSVVSLMKEGRDFMIG